MVKRKLIQTQKPVDSILLIIVGLLLATGLLVLYSASTVQSFKDFGNTTHYIMHQLLYGGLVGVVGLYICARLDYRIWGKLVPVALLVAAILLVLVKVPGIGFSANGATRWIHLGPIVFQPGEMAKAALLFYIAGWVSKRQHSMNDFVYGILPTLFITGLFALLILWQPDVGTMLVLLSTTMIMLFLGGLRIQHFTALLVSGIAALFLIIKIEPYRAHRLLTFLDSSHDPLGLGYQINQALLAIGAGGFFGYGYGLSRQKHNYLPETLGDSIFAVAAEELGFVRILFILALFIAFMLRGIYIASRAPDSFGRMLALGITISITVQALINMGAILGILPLTGIPLPFFSYGSTALIINLCEIGILLNISRQIQA